MDLNVLKGWDLIQRDLNQIVLNEWVLNQMLLNEWLLYQMFLNEWVLKQRLLNEFDGTKMSLNITQIDS